VWVGQNPAGSCRNTAGKHHLRGCIQNVIKVLEEVELGKMEDLDFLEAMACVEGVWVVLSPWKTILWLSKELRNSQKVAEKQNSGGKEPAEDEYQKKYDLGLERVRWKKPLERSDAMELSSDIARALTMMQRIDEVLATLPGLDCGSCGAPTCKHWLRTLSRISY